MAQQALPEALSLTLQIVFDPDRGEYRLTVQGPGEQLDFQIGTKHIRRVEDLAMIRAQEQDLKQVVLITRYLTTHLARKAVDLGIQFLDAAGNIHLRTPRSLLCIIGNKLPVDVEALEQVKTFKAFNRKGLQVVFGLLAGGDLKNAPYRDLSKAVGVARGTVGEVLKDLIGSGYALQKDGERILLQKDSLAKGWLANYPHKLRPYLQVKRYRANEPDWWKNVVLDPVKAQWGGEVAADRLTGCLQPGTVTIYSAVPPEKLAAQFRLRPDPHGNIEILHRFWDFPYPQGYPADLVPAMLIFADLVASGDPRNADIAREIHDTHLALS